VSLGQWISPPLQDKHRWRWLISPSAHAYTIGLVHGKYITNIQTHLHISGNSRPPPHVQLLNPQPIANASQPFYIISTHHGHNNKPNKAADWTAYLGNLPEETKWVFTHSNLKETGPSLAAMLATQPVIAVSNGSFNDTQGTATWVMHTESAPKMAITHWGANDPKSAELTKLIQKQASQHIRNSNNHRYNH